MGSYIHWATLAVQDWVMMNFWVDIKLKAVILYIQSRYWRITHPITLTFVDWSQSPKITLLPDTMVACGGDDINEDIDVSKESLSKRARHLSVFKGHFWKLWKTEFLPQFWEYHWHCNGDNSVHQPKIGDILVYENICPRDFWKLAKIESLLKGWDEVVRRAAVVSPKESRTRVLSCLLKILYWLKVECQV